MPGGPGVSPDRGAQAAVVIPIRSFEAGKSRLGAHLDPARRAELLRAMAENVVAAAGAMPVAVVSNAREVRAWAPRLGLTVLDDPGTLDLAAAAGLGWAGASGFARVVVAHADLPLATSLGAGGRRRLAGRWSPPSPATVTTARRSSRCRRRATGFVFAYGPGSFRRHAAAARAAGLAFRVRARRPPRARRGRPRGPPRPRPAVGRAGRLGALLGA